MKDLVKRVVYDIVKDGTEWSGKDDLIIIRWPWDRDDKNYLGAAHGLAGVLQMLMQAILIVEGLKEDETLMKVVRGSCQFILTQ